MSMRQRRDRRSFLKGAAGVCAAPFIVPASALGRDGFPAPSERVTLGCIGTGVMGQGDMGGFLSLPDVRVVAVCDVKTPQREQARDAVNNTYGTKDCASYNDFRELLARDDIDVVSIASNDHWHVLHALAAARAGKDMYVEKPLGMSLEEIFTLRREIERHGRVFQFGTQQRSSREFRFGCELVRNGRIGELKKVLVGVHAGAAERSGIAHYEPQPVPDGIDYDLWLGPAPLKPYHEARVSRPYWFHASDYSLGYVGGWGIHHIDIAQWGMGMENSGPLEIEARAQFPRGDAFCDNPVSWDAHLLYPGGVEMHFTGSGPGFTGVRHGITFEGTEGSVWVNRGAIETQPESLLREKLGPNELHLPVSNHHQRNLIDCVKTRDDTVCPIDVAVRSDTVCQLTWIAFQLGRKLRWDPDAERFVGDPEANLMQRRAMRRPWCL